MADLPHDYDATRRSWNIATRNHNAHKGDQAARLRSGDDTLFPEELELLGPLAGQRLVHLQCNAGQDTLSLARRGARALGVDLSDGAIAFARELSTASGIPADFEQAEVVSWLAQTEERFDLAFCSYGATGWLPDINAWACGVARVLRPGGRLVYVEFHPLVWCLDKQLGLHGDDYFKKGPYIEPVGDYVAESREGLGVVTVGQTEVNTVPAYSWQHTFGEVLEALCQAGLVLNRVREYPYSNGFRPDPLLVAGEGRRWHWPEGFARLPLMYGIAATKP